MSEKGGLDLAGNIETTEGVHHHGEGLEQEVYQLHRIWVFDVFLQLGLRKHVHLMTRSKRHRVSANRARTRWAAAAS